MNKTGLDDEDSRHKPPSHGIWLPSASRVRRSRPRFVLGGGALTARTGVKSVVSGGAFGLTRTGAHEGHLCPRRCRSSQQGWRSPGARRAQAVQDGGRRWRPDDHSPDLHALPAQRTGEAVDGEHSP